MILRYLTLHFTMIDRCILILTIQHQGIMYYFYGIWPLYFACQQMPLAILVRIIDGVGKLRESL